MTGIGHSREMDLYCDSQLMVHIAAGLVFHEHMKHLELDCYFIRDDIKIEIIRKKNIFTMEKLPNIFTKTLVGHPFHTLVSKLNIYNLCALI